MITIYTKPDCIACETTKKYLKNKLGVDYNEIDVTKNQSALQLVQNLGYNTAPVITVTDQNDTLVEHWHGYNPAKMRKLAGQP